MYCCKALLSIMERALYKLFIIIIIYLVLLFHRVTTTLYQSKCLLSHRLYFTLTQSITEYLVHLPFLKSNLSLLFKGVTVTPY